MPNSSVFDRLSTTPTKASSNRDEEKKIHNNEKMALRQAEEALASPRKEGVNIYTSANSSPSLTSPKRTPREMNQFFERISKQDTESSKIHHHEIERNSSPTKKKSCAKEGDDVIAALFVNNEVVDLATMIPEVRISIINNCKQKLSSRSCALDIIEALWKRDYIDHYTIGWDVYPASGEESRDHEGVWDGEILCLICKSFYHVRCQLTVFISMY